MSIETKTLTDKQLTQIIMQIVFDKYPIIDEYQTYGRFVEDLGKLVTEYCGGDVIGIEVTGSKAMAVRIARNDSVPDDGGIYANFDSDISWVRNRETSSMEIVL